jgi:hypothetical protein
MLSLRTSLVNGEPKTVAHLIGADGRECEIPYEAAMAFVEQSRPPVAVSVPRLEQDVLGFLFLLFQHERQHPVVLDGRAIGVQIGAAPTADYFHYINGHTLTVDERSKEAVYTSLTYVDCITPQETVWLEGARVAGIAIHDFMSAPTRVEPDDARFHGQLEHVRDCLEAAVLRVIYDTPPDGEATVAAEDVARAAVQFEAAMYG